MNTDPSVFLKIIIGAVSVLILVGGLTYPENIEAIKKWWRGRKK